MGTGSFPMLWVDLETTDDDIFGCEIVEVAVVLNSPDGRRLEADDFLVELSADGMARLRACPEAMAMHQASGLWADYLDVANLPLRLVDAERRLLDLLDRHRLLREKAAVRLAGSGVATFDYPILRRTMPELMTLVAATVHDVGVLRRAYRYATGSAMATTLDSKNHRASVDVEAAIAEWGLQSAELDAAARALAAARAAETREAS